MLVWGGLALVDNSELADGAGYDPLTDTWQPLPTDSAPAGRHNHTAVWAGDEMIVWGGAGDNSYQPDPLGDGARYFPSVR